MVEFVTDRTKNHVSRLKALAAKGWNNMTASEQSEWLGTTGDTWKGAYNYTDLNRVETAVQELSDMLGLNLTTKTDWNAQDVPTQADMERYLGNVQIIRNNYTGTGEIPEAPDTSIRIGYYEANTIERILEMSYEIPVDFHVIEDGKLIILGALSTDIRPDCLYLDCTPDPDTPEDPDVDWIYPVQNGNVLTIEQVYGAVQNGNVLTVE